MDMQRRHGQSPIQPVPMEDLLSHLCPIRRVSLRCRLLYLRFLPTGTCGMVGIPTLRQYQSLRSRTKPAIRKRDRKCLIHLTSKRFLLLNNISSTNRCPLTHNPNLLRATLNIHNIDNPNLYPLVKHLLNNTDSTRRRTNSPSLQHPNQHLHSRYQTSSPTPLTYPSPPPPQQQAQDPPHPSPQTQSAPTYSPSSHNPCTASPRTKSRKPTRRCPPCAPKTKQ